MFFTNRDFLPLVCIMSKMLGMSNDGNAVSIRSTAAADSKYRPIHLPNVLHVLRQFPTQRCNDVPNTAVRRGNVLHNPQFCSISHKIEDVEIPSEEHNFDSSSRRPPEIRNPLPIPSHPVPFQGAGWRREIVWPAVP